MLGDCRLRIYHCNWLVLVVQSPTTPDCWQSLEDSAACTARFQKFYPISPQKGIFPSLWWGKKIIESHQSSIGSVPPDLIPQGLQNCLSDFSARPGAIFFGGDRKPDVFTNQENAYIASGDTVYLIEYLLLLIFEAKECAFFSSNKKYKSWSAVICFSLRRSSCTKIRTTKKMNDGNTQS